MASQNIQINPKRFDPKRKWCNQASEKFKDWNLYCGMSKWRKEAIVWGGEIRYQMRVQRYSKVGCDTDKETGKVLGLWVIFRTFVILLEKSFLLIFVADLRFCFLFLGTFHKCYFFPYQTCSVQKALPRFVNLGELGSLPSSTVSTCINADHSFDMNTALCK